MSYEETKGDVCINIQERKRERGVREGSSRKVEGVMESLCMTEKEHILNCLCKLSVS